MKGVILAIPVVNGPQFEHRTAYISPIDQLNQNRFFPGDPKGTLTHRTAHTIFSKVLSKADALCDCHGGDISEQIIGWVNAIKGKDEELNLIAREMAACFPCKVIFSRVASKNEEPGMTGVAQDKLGIPCIIPESNAPHQTTRELERYIKFNYEGIQNLLKYFEIMEGKPSMSNAVIDPEEYTLTADKGGIWHSKVEAGQVVEPGHELGNITDLFGNIIEVFEAPKKSFIKVVRMWYSVNCGDKVIEAAYV
jgi:predicted deacylase